MSEDKRVKIRELKSKLSSYIKDVRQGTTITVCDREEAVAELRPVSIGAPDAVLKAWASTGDVILPDTTADGYLKRAKVDVSPGLAQQLLDTERGE